MNFGGRIRLFTQNWKEITSDTTILDMIEGVQLEFHKCPQQKFTPKSYKFEKEDKQLITEELSTFFNRSIIERAISDPDQIVSNIFSRKKKSGKVRIILNLSELNKDIEYHKFKMETVQSVLDMVRSGFFFCSIDLSDAYFCVNVRPEFRKYLRFIWDDQLYQFTCLPQGLSSSPRLYTKIMKVAISYLRERNIIISNYIDDLIIMARDFDTCKEHFYVSTKLLQTLGFVINWEKSSTIPSRTISHLGLVINSRNMTVRVDKDKCCKIKSACQSIKHTKNPTVRQIASLIGTMVSYTPGVENGLLHYRHLEACKSQTLRHNGYNFDRQVSLDSKAFADISWWEENVDSEFTNLLVEPPQVFITTDSSLQAWGAVRADCKTGGSWSNEEKTMHINVLELKAILFGLKSLCRDVSGKHIRVRCDNTCSVSYVNAKGGSKSLECNTIASEIWHWCLDRGNIISAEHIPGILNQEADFESRNQNHNTEWSLDRTVTNRIFKVFNLIPSVDLFATRINTKVEKFVSWKPDPLAS